MQILLEHIHLEEVIAQHGTNTAMRVTNRIILGVALHRNRQQRAVRETEEGTTPGTAINASILGSIEDTNQNICQTTDEWKITVNTNEEFINFKIGTGADVNVIDTKHLHTIGKTIANIHPNEKSLTPVNYNVIIT